MLIKDFMLSDIRINGNSFCMLVRIPFKIKAEDNPNGIVQTAQNINKLIIIMHVPPKFHKSNQVFLLIFRIFQWFLTKLRKWGSKRQSYLIV